HLVRFASGEGRAALLAWPHAKRSIYVLERVGAWFERRHFISDGSSAARQRRFQSQSEQTDIKSEPSACFRDQLRLHNPENQLQFRGNQGAVGSGKRLGDWRSAALSEWRSDPRSCFQQWAFHT